MHLKTLFVSILLTVPVQAATLSMEECLPLLKAAELDPTPATYDQCGFNDPNQALVEWPPILEQNKLAHALYESCIRHPKNPQSSQYCKLAAKLGDGPAVAWAGDLYYKKDQIPKAMSYYNYALQRGGLTVEQEGQIITKLGMLYAHPNSVYYNATEAIPLLQKAALKRSAMANNIMGYFTFAGLYGIQKDDKAAFAYFWRAVLLGCPAAQENIGLFHMAVEQKELDMQTTLDLMSQRAFTCEASKEAQVELENLVVDLYHLSFTPQECADINYYAERLVDTNLPFTGKKECAFSKDMQEINQLLNK